ncbi:MAG TPA: hypothetical protein VFL94_06755 [Actinomycetales bacterium]|nr:hypothetical protein [Actinomycetales bacterium]
MTGIRARLVGLVIGVTLVAAVTACGGDDSGSAKAPARPWGDSALPTGQVVTQGPARFTLSDGVQFVEAPSETPAPGTTVRRWTFAGQGQLPTCVVLLNVQSGYTGDFPAGPQQVFDARVKVQGGTVLTNEPRPGPGGAKAGLLQHETSPHLGKNQDTTGSTWTTSFVTDKGSYVQLAASAAQDDESRCQIESIAKSLEWTGDEAPSSGASSA